MPRSASCTKAKTLYMHTGHQGPLCKPTCHTSPIPAGKFLFALVEHSQLLWDLTRLAILNESAELRERAGTYSEACLSSCSETVGYAFEWCPTFLGHQPCEEQGWSCSERVDPPQHCHCLVWTAEHSCTDGDYTQSTWLLNHHHQVWDPGWVVHWLNDANV